MLAAWTIRGTLAVCLSLALASVQPAGRVDCRQPDEEQLEAHDYDSGGEYSEEHVGETGNEPEDVYANELVMANKTRQNHCVGATCTYRQTCGKAPLNSFQGRRLTSKNTPFIINGSPQNYGDWPSFATFIRRFIDPYTMKPFDGSCGGVIISDRHILTAAHCVLDGYSERIPLVDMRIVLGDNTRATDSNEKIYRVRDVCVSKKLSYYTEGKINHMRYDFAILTLTKKIEFNDYRQPACLPYIPEFDIPAGQGLPCFLMGWGHVGYDPNEKPIAPQRIMTIPIALRPCQPPYKDDSSRMCITKDGSPGNACHGDSGGPVLCLHPVSKRWTVVGLISYGPDKCEPQAGREWQAVIARVPTILQNIKQDCQV